MEQLSSNEWNELISKANSGSKKKGPSRKLEEGLQISCVKWFTYQYPAFDKLLFAIPNGGSRNRIEAANLKRQGVKSGVSDIILLVPSFCGKYNSLCIEMKYGNGKQSDEQLIFQHKAVLNGNRYEVCRSLEDFKRVVVNHLGR